MNMSMDKPMVLINTEGTRGPQVKKMHKKASLGSYRPGSRNMNMSMDKPIVLINTEGIRGPQVEKCINGFKFETPKLFPELPGGF